MGNVNNNEDALNRMLAELSEYGKAVNYSNSLEDNQTIRIAFMQGLQHILNGGSVKDIVEEMNLCIEVGEMDKGAGFCKALEHIKRHVENSIDYLRLQRVLGNDKCFHFFSELQQKLNENIILD